MSHIWTLFDILYCVNKVRSMWSLTVFVQKTKATRCCPVDSIKSRSDEICTVNQFCNNCILYIWWNNLLEYFKKMLYGVNLDFD